MAMIDQSSLQSASLTGRLHRVYSDLPAGERKVADFVLDRPGELAAFTGVELAGHVGVSNATVSRLFRRLGYRAYDEARQASRDMREAGSPLYLTGNDDADMSLRRLFETDQEILARTAAMTDTKVFKEIAQRLATAENVRVAGLRNSFYVAEYLRAGLSRIRPNVYALIQPGQTLGERLAEIGREDIVVIVGLRRRIQRFPTIVRSVAETGADVALIADRSVRQSPQYARWNLTVAVDTLQPMDSYVGVMALVRALAIETLSEIGQDGRRSLERVEWAHETLDELE